MQTNIKCFAKRHIGAINGNDIWLLVFFAIHIAYIALNVFFPLSSGDEKSVLDIVMRTSAAVLVGYFLSKSFASEKPSHSSKPRLAVQTNIVGITGLFSIVLILIVRYADSTALPYNTIVQLRDFYLAAIAFLMGTSK